MARSYKRRKFFIKKELQGRLILGCFLAVAGGGLLFNVLLGLLSADSLTISYSNQDFQLGQTPVMLLKQVLAANWFLLAIGGTILVVAIMLLSHRIAGPLLRFEMTLDSMKKGRLDKTIHLRDKDEGKELARKINEFNGQLSRSFRAINSNSRAVETLIEQATSLDLPEEEKEQLAGLCWSMQEHIRKITKNSNYYCTRDE